MRARMVGLVFVLGLVAVGVAVAGMNRNWSTHAKGRSRYLYATRARRLRRSSTCRRTARSFEYKLIASNIENVVQAHIHRGPPGVNGPIGVFLYGLVPPGGGRTDGVLSHGTITAATSSGPFDGMSRRRGSRAHGRGPGVRERAHERRDRPITGPGDFPGGEVRGDIR